MKGNIIAIFMNILSVVLIVFIVLLYLKKDRVAPEFRFSTLDMTYNAETEEDELLQGIAAYDSVDGDVSSRIAVEKVVLNKDDALAVVYYAVSDLSGNVSKQSRVFGADIESFVEEDDSEVYEYGDGDDSRVFSDITETSEYDTGIYIGEDGQPISSDASTESSSD